MESLGEHLRNEREVRNLSLQEVARATRIRERLLKAIEEDRYDLLPPPFYVKSYLGAYARYLGFDPGQIILRYQGLDSLAPSALNQTAPPIQARISRKSIAILKTRSKSRLVALKAVIGGFFFVTLVFFGFVGLSGWDFTPVEKESILVQSKAEAKKAVESIQREISMIGETEARDGISAEAPFYEALEAEIGKTIELENGRSVLKERCSEFSCDNQRAYFLTRIKTKKEGKVTHLWYRDGKEFQRLEIEVKPPSWTVYTYLTLRPGLAGNWMAELRDGNAILSSRNFKAVELPAF